ncbi:hypothetical protein ZIOFF_021327 [Zingiber officinale]|uniref:LysM domain-containing protein n=1 Tax=Zingiber officinale TaxID=94328 RepID=A0A8J5H3P5_ZINOF|nr:hypothetical protein ZIOFF_021327 [Zingiber officinale]
MSNESLEGDVDGGGRRRCRGLLVRVGDGLGGSERQADNGDRSCGIMFRSTGRLFPLKEIVQYPLPGYVAPSSINFSPDGRLISYLFSPDGTLHRKVFAFEVASRRQELVICPPDGGGLDESNLSAEEKLRRERSRERGLGVMSYSACLSADVGLLRSFLPLACYFGLLQSGSLPLALIYDPVDDILDCRSLAVAIPVAGKIFARVRLLNASLKLDYKISDGFDIRSYGFRICGPVVDERRIFRLPTLATTFPALAVDTKIHRQPTTRCQLSDITLWSIHLVRLRQTLLDTTTLSVTGSDVLDCRSLAVAIPVAGKIFARVRLLNASLKLDYKISDGFDIRSYGFRICGPVVDELPRKSSSCYQSVDPERELEIITILEQEPLCMLKSQRAPFLIMLFYISELLVFSSLATIMAAGFKGELNRFQPGVRMEIFRLDAWTRSKKKRALVSMANNASARFYILAIVVALLLTFSSSAEGRLGQVPSPASPAPICDDVHGAVEGDTCFAVAQEFNLTPAQFSAINPNINCDKVFIGQWLCIKGTA